MTAEIHTCALCPRLCRPVCPVAVGSQREAAVPANMARVLVAWDRGQASPELASQAVTLCTDCGACEAFCHLGMPLPKALRETRAELLPEPLMEPVRPVEGEGSTLVIESDGRGMADAVARRLGAPVRRLFTADQLGVAAVEHPAWAERAREIREATHGIAEIVVVDGGVARALTAAGVSFRWLHEVFPSLAIGLPSCAVGGTRPLACCGAAGPLRTHHPDDARRVGRAWLARADTQDVLDARCRNHLLGCGGLDATDPLDRLLAEET